MRVLIACEYSGTVRNAFIARVHMMSLGPDRWRERSRTFAGIAEAMADQWGGAIPTLALAA
ncbi:hypothetical protein [Tanticharoenia sakaeratensis]|uniref:Uncharacterized protein n=2 Tax=Tanticharoenia TaxID=444052 RepID=A0A0D6MN73_9PROT|nr:hypothetical protein [Tanticharoenia sakaeratensis]GAN54845.1 hypothetical protein Tasa_031_063 [Tanticharoenia sakaeratensis NBRC 103193]GBQ21384.1 hypothetical protein AA103193_1710 [Tanticharoenia sakaeratensis NBRC 103193]